MVIFNRWGQLIFETTNPAEGWDGKDAPAGVYSWVISYSDMVGEGFKNEGECGFDQVTPHPALSSRRGFYILLN